MKQKLYIGFKIVMEFLDDKYDRYKVNHILNNRVESLCNRINLTEQHA